MKWLGRNWLVLLGIVFLCTFIGTHYKFPAEDKYKILLDLILIMVALNAAIGYWIFRWISRGVADQVEKDRQQIEQTIAKESQLIKESRKLTTAMTSRNAGYIFWAIFDVEKKRMDKTSVKPEEFAEYFKELLENAVGYTRKALKIFQELPKDIRDENEREIYLCMNNLIYYLAESHKVKDYELSKEEKSEALNLAKELSREVSGQNYPNDFYDFQESSAWALFHLSEDDRASKDKAYEIIRKLLLDADIPNDWRKDKKKQWKKYFSAL